jgi:hypothetical protein
MDPAIANLDLDPPAPPSLVRRGLVPALCVNALFVVALAWSVPWHRASQSDRGVSASSDLGSMGGPPVATAPSVQPAPVTPLPPSVPQAASPAQPRATELRAPQVAAVPQPGSPFPAAATAPAPAQAPERNAAPRPPVVAAATPAPRTSQGPSFDCAKARSRTEKLICADPELAQLDRDLGRLNVRARTLSPDPVAFRRAGDVEWKRRETECRDKACLLAWYAQRRAQLQAVVAERS